MEETKTFGEIYDESIAKCMSLFYSRVENIENIYWWEAIKNCRWQDIDKVLEARRIQSR